MLSHLEVPKKQLPEFRNLSIRWAIAAALFLVPLELTGLAPLSQLVAPGIMVPVTEGLDLALANSIIGGTFVFGVLLCWLSRTPELLVWLIQTAGLAVIFVVARRQKWSGITALLAGFVYLCLTFVVVLSIGSGHGLIGGYNEIVKAISKEMDQSLALYKKTSTGTYKAEIENWSLWFHSTIIYFLPGLLASVYLVISLTNILIAKIYLDRKLKIDAFGPAFIQWKLPDQLVWAMIASGGLAFLGKGIYKTGGNNALLVLSTMYFLQGIAITAFYFKRLKVPTFIRWITYILLSIQWYGLLIFVIVGLSDTWFDLRSRAPASE